MEFQPNLIRKQILAKARRVLQNNPLAFQIFPDNFDPEYYSEFSEIFEWVLDKLIEEFPEVPIQVKNLDRQSVTSTGEVFGWRQCYLAPGYHPAQRIFCR